MQKRKGKLNSIKKTTSFDSGAPMGFNKGMECEVINKIEPKLRLSVTFWNTYKRHCDDIHLLPTIGFRPWKKRGMAILRYPEGCYESEVQLAFKWLVWEFAVCLSKRNFSYS